jgi:hypothetical protein
MAENNAEEKKDLRRGQRKRSPPEITPQTPRELLGRFKEPKKKG